VASRVQKVTDNTRDERQRQSFHLLLLASHDHAWKHAVQGAAIEMGDVSIQNAASAHEAISHLVVGDPDYSHLLVEFGCADEQIGELAKLTKGESHNDTALVMLGANGHNPPRSDVVRLADVRAVKRAILSSDSTGRPKIAPLRLDELQTALSGEQLHTRYQPIVRLSDREPVGLEVLARLDHPAHGTLSPGHFVPQMEKAGLSRQLTTVVVAQAFKDHSAYFAPLGLWLALNFPLDVLLDEPMLDWLDQQRQAAGIAAKQIIVELTESQPVADLGAEAFATLQRSIARLRDAGYGVALDDVGPEMADHTALFKLNFTSAKLDMGLVTDSADDPAAQSFLSQTISLARKAGCDVVAEGVKDHDTWERMRLAGADQAQGFMVARPLPAAAVRVWLDAWRARVN
jgi:EAL domain-containing protein (putative c-di-GMP-specific phosphodiesterase class I)